MSANGCDACTRDGRPPIWPHTAHDTRDTDDGFVEHRALFTVKDIH